MQPPSIALRQLPPSVRSLIDAELNDGERITWIGTPNPRRFAMQSIVFVLFGIPWTAFALFWMAGAAGFGIPDFNEGFDLFPLFGIPFVLIGFGMLSSPYWVIRKAKKTAYVLTSERAIIFAGGFSATTVRSFVPDRLTNLQRKQHDDGSGDLIFERTVSMDSDGDQRSTDHGFLAIANVKEVEDRIRQLVEASSREEA